MSRLSGPAVEDKGLLEIVAPYWRRINTKASAALKRSARGFLPADPADEEDVLGCGAWGCVWQTADKRFVIKVSLDATEGPIIAQIMSQKSLRLNPGCVYYRAIWQLPDLVWTNQFGHAPVWVILREEAGRIDWTNERGDIRRKYMKIHADLEDLPDAACELVNTRADLEFCKTVECAYAYTDAERAFMEYVIDLRTTEARHVGSFMADAYAAGILLGDVHPGNVGRRKHNLKAFGVKGHRQMVVTDVGDQGQPICDRDKHPKIRTMKNPYHPRNAGVMAYWASQVPIL
jgi:hypothetical protein